jgi:GDP-L-fucose synthase
MNILVAGGSGFIGSNMLEFLVNKENINITTTFFNTLPKVKNKKIKVVKANLESFKTCNHITKNIDIVFMFAGHVFSQASLKKVLDNNKENQNLNISINMIKSSINNKVKKFVWLSSFTGYPNLESTMSENQFFDSDPPLNYFIPGQQARFIEKILFFFSKLKHSTEILVVRPSEIFGKYDNFDLNTCHAFPAYIVRLNEALKNGKNFVNSVGNISNIKNYIFCSDLVKIIFRLTKKNKKKNFNAYNISSSHNYSLKQIFNILLKFKRFEGIQILIGKTKKNKKIKRLISNSKVKKEIKFLNETKFETCVKKTLDWYLNSKYASKKKR